MAQKSYTCFFITPTGKKDSEERKNAELVLDALLRPVLAQCEFPEEGVLPSYQEATPTISQQMINRLKDDDLCIADLTGLNANVMYELGYRKGIGKPVILIAHDGQNLPFDVHDDRTVFYDLSDVQHLLETQKILKRQIIYWKDAGFVESEGSSSVTAINDRLNSIERKLDDTIAGLGSARFDRFGGDEADQLIRELGSVVSAFNYALKTRNTRLAEALLPRVESDTSKEYYLDRAVESAVSLGSTVAASILKSEWTYIVENFTTEQRYEAIASFVSYCNRHDSEQKELDFLEKEINALLKDPNSSDEIKAGLFNQLNRIYHGIYAVMQNQGKNGIEYLDKAIDSLLAATKLDPKEASYYYNLALCYQARGNLDKACNSISKCIEMDMNANKSDPDHLVLAYKLYREKQDIRAKDIYKELETNFPRRTALIDD